MRRHALLVIIGLVLAACGGGATAATGQVDDVTLSGVEIDVHETPG